MWDSLSFLPCMLLGLGFGRLTFLDGKWIQCERQGEAGREGRGVVDNCIL